MSLPGGTERRIAAPLLRWFDQHGRKDLPWQQERTAYRVWISEIMLQQTQVATVIPYYQRFMATFPSVLELADAPLDDVLQHWSGLGYYARARNLHRAAVAIRDEHGGEFPSVFDDVVALPGIGRSTAGAILALSFGQRFAILDGNAKRVLARYHAIEGWPGSTKTANALWDVAERHTPDKRVGDYTQAIMDLGATLCVRRKPHCDRCPISEDCQALAAGDVHAYPGRKPRKDKPQKSTCMLLAHVDGNLYLERRPAHGIWGGLWSLPELEEVTEVDDWCRRRLGTLPNEVSNWTPIRHSFSHYDLEIQPLEVRLNSTSRKVADAEDARWFAPGERRNVGLAAPVKTLIEQLEASGVTP